MFDSSKNLLGEKISMFDGVGTKVNMANCIDEVMTLAGLDFEVKQTELMANVGNGIIIPTGHFANYRTDNNDILGVVKGRYTVVNNSECFAFVDDIASNGNFPVEFNTAGALKGGKRTWISAKLPEAHILGDSFNPFLVFANSHDGSTGITVSITNIRVWCMNTLNMAIKTGQRVFSFNHCTNVKERMEEAKRTLENYDKYQREYEKEAERLYAKKLTNEDIKAIFDKLFTVKGSISERKAQNIVDQRNAVQLAYNAYDIQHSFANTAWGVLNAVGDFTSHAIPQRKTENYRENKIEELWNGNKLFDEAYKLIA